MCVFLFINKNILLLFQVPFVAFVAFVASVYQISAVEEKRRTTSSVSRLVKGLLDI